MILLRILKVKFKKKNPLMNRRDYLHPNAHGRLLYLLYHIVHNIQFLILYVPSLQLL